MDKPEWWLENLWLPLLLLVIGGTFASRWLRDHAWLPALRIAWRALRWPFTLRVSTTARLTRSAEAHAAELREAQAEVAAARAEAERVRITSVERVAALIDEIGATKALAAEEAEKARLEQSRQAAQAVERAQAEGRAAAQAEVAAQRAGTRVKPVWQVEPRGEGAYALNDVQGVTGLRNVSIDVQLPSFEFHGPTQFTGEFGGSVIFLGARTREGALLGVEFLVSWQDATGDHWEGAARLDRQSPSSWTMG